MKWFYAIAILLVGTLVALPQFYLDDEEEGQYDGLTIGWNPDGSPIRKEKAVVLHDGWASTIRSWDQVTCGDTTSASIQANLYEGLYGYHYLKRPPSEKTIVPLLAAERPTITNRGRVYTIKIKPDVKYSRNPCFGTEPGGRHGTRLVAAQDFVLTFKRCADYHIRPSLPWSLISAHIKGLQEYRKKTKRYKIRDFSRYDLPVEGIQALNDHTLQITLNDPFPQFIYVLAMHSYAPTPREAVDYWLGRSKPPSAEFRGKESLVGTGPYLLHEFRTKDKLVLIRNPDFRPDFYPTEGEPGDEELGLLKDAGKRAPFIDVISWRWMPQPYSAWMTFLAKRRDAAGVPRETFEMVITPGRDLTDRWRKRSIYLRKSWSPSVFWIAFNLEDEVIGNSKSLRQALCAAYDVENHIKVLYNGRGKRAVNMLPSTFPGHKEVGPGPYYRLDLETAKRKIADAKQELGAKGLLDGDDIPQLTLDMARGARAATFAEFVKQQFRKIGVRLKVNYSDWSTLQERVTNKQTQLYTMGWHADYPDGENFFQLFWSENIDKGTNDTNYSDAEYDAWYEAARVMPDTPERMALYVKMGRKINEDCPVLLLGEPLGFVLYYDWVQNVKSHPIGYGFAKYRRIDLDLRRKLGGRN